MDQHRFDAIARELATTGNRRRLFRAALAALAMSAFPRRRRVLAQETCANACPAGEICLNGGCYRQCENHRDCRSKRDDPCLSNSCIDGVCIEAIVDCVPGFECCDGECCPKACSHDAECAVLDPCRWGSCGVDGYCVFTEVVPCPICTSDEDCRGSGQNTICCDGSCQRPCPEGTVMGKGCECWANGSATLDGLVVRDDASG